ncbi:MAG: hypothetical protein ACLRZH_07985 [Ruthenibacterium lactatiformans]
MTVRLLAFTQRAWSWPGGWRRSYPARPRCGEAARWALDSQPLPTRTRLSIGRGGHRGARRRLMPE